MHARTYKGMCECHSCGSTWASFPWNWPQPRGSPRTRNDRVPNTTCRVPFRATSGAILKSLLKFFPLSSGVMVLVGPSRIVLHVLSVAIKSRDCRPPTASDIRMPGDKPTLQFLSLKSIGRTPQYDHDFKSTPVPYQVPRHTPMTRTVPSCRKPTWGCKATVLRNPYPKARLTA